MAITLHHCHETRSMRVLWLLNELKIDFDVAVYPFDATLRSADFLKLNPAGRVPALEIDGQAMFESGAMVEYLSERFPEAGLWRAVGHTERAEWLTWVHFSETLTQHIAILNQQHNFIYPPEARSPVVMKLEVKRAEKCLSAIESRLIDGRSHLLDGGFSAADVAVGQAVYMARFFVHIDAFPHVSAWYARLSQRPAFQASLPKDGDARLFQRDFHPPLPIS